MTGVLQEFQGSTDHGVDLNLTRDDFSEKLSKKRRHVAKPSSFTRRSRSPARFRNKSPDSRQLPLWWQIKQTLSFHFPGSNGFRTRLWWILWRKLPESALSVTTTELDRCLPASNPYYISLDQDNNDPDFSLHAQEDSFDDDSDPAFTPKQITIMKSTMRDNLKEFQGFSL